MIFMIRYQQNLYFGTINIILIENKQCSLKLFLIKDINNDLYFKYKFEMKNQTKIRKSSSLAFIKLDKIDFNPLQFQVGNSRIDKLHLVTQKSQHVNAEENCVNEVLKLKKMNKQLKAQNSQLKNKLQSFINNQVEKIKRSNINQDSTSNNNTSKDYKVAFLSRMNKSKCPSSTLCQTGLFSNKESLTETTISDIYQNWKQKGKKPDTEKMLSLSKRYLQEFQENFLKLKLMNDSIEPSTQLESRYKKQMEDYLTLFKVPLVFKKNPQLLARSVSGQKMRQSSKQKSSFQIELRSFEQTITMLENILKKILNSSKMLQILKNNQIFCHFIKKMKPLF